MIPISTELRNMVEQRINNDIIKLNCHYNTNHQSPPVKYDARGASAGFIYGKDNFSTIHLNPILLTENVDEMINQTISHELAHYWSHIINGTIRTRSGNRSIHGTKWKLIMRVLGVVPDRCHHMAISGAVTRIKHKFEYMCSKCNHKLTVGPVVHKKLQKGDHRWHTGCGQNSRVLYVGYLGQVTYQQARKARLMDTPTLIPPTGKGTTKR